MTTEAVAALEHFQTQLFDLSDDLTEAEWLQPSACPGWRVRDVVAHIAAGARNIIDPIPMPEERLPLPTNREREHDVHVDIRRGWSIDDVVEEFRRYGEERLTRLAALQEEPLASTEVEIPGLGSYPMHAAANGMAFDYFCHLHHDILRPLGPLDRPAPSFDHEHLYPVVQWMMWGLPQMQGPELDASLLAPLTLDLTGPGASTWTISRPDPDLGLVVEEADAGSVTVRSSAADFVAWGTGRAPWPDFCAIEGDQTLAAPFLSTLDII